MIHRKHFFSFFQIAFVAFVFLFLAAPFITNAGGGYVLLEPLPTLEGNTAPTFIEYISAVYKLTIGFAGVLAVFMIIIGGVEYIFSAIPSAKSDARSRIVGAVMGLLLVLTAWILLNTINPAFLEKGFGLAGVGGGGTFNQPGGGSNPADQGKTYCTTFTSNGNYICYENEQDCQEGLKNPPSKLPSCRAYDGELAFVQEELDTRSAFLDHGILVSNDSCGSPEVNGSQHNCTNVYGYKLNGWLTTLVAFKNACDAATGDDGCDFTILNGTESGIPGHGVGSKAVDIVEIDNFGVDENTSADWEINVFLGIQNLADGVSATKNGMTCTFKEGGHNSSGDDVWHCEG